MTGDSAPVSDGDPPAPEPGDDAVWRVERLLKRARSQVAAGFRVIEQANQVLEEEDAIRRRREPKD